MAGVLITVRISPAMLAEIDATAAGLEISRSDLVKARLRWAVAAERVCHTAEPAPVLMAAE